MKNKPDQPQMQAQMQDYRRLEQQLRARIQQGHWPAGTKLPGRMKLAREYAVGVATIERAIAPLVSEGLLSADSRSGTFVADGSAERRATRSHPAPFSDSPLTGGDPDVPEGSLLDASFGIIAPFNPEAAAPSEIQQVWYRTIISSMERTLSGGGGTARFASLIGPDGQTWIPVRAAVEALLADGADAIALIDFDAAALTEALSGLELGRVPLVCIVDGEIGLPVMQVFYDHRSSGYQAAHHLLRRGCREILFLTPFLAPWLDQRLQGARDAVRQAGLPADALRVFPDEGRRELAEASANYTESGYLAARAAFGKGLVRAGVIAPNDFTAYGVLQAAAEAGREAGVDFGLVGFDDNTASRGLGLTTLHPPLEALGSEAGRLLTRALHGDHASQHVRLRSHLIARSSTRLSPRHRPHDFPGSSLPSSLSHVESHKGEIRNVHV